MGRKCRCRMTLDKGRNRQFQQIFVRCFEHFKLKQRLHRFSIQLEKNLIMYVKCEAYLHRTLNIYWLTLNFGPFKLFWTEFDLVSSLRPSPWCDDVEKIWQTNIVLHCVALLYIVINVFAFYLVQNSVQSKCCQGFLFASVMNCVPREDTTVWLQRFKRNI